MFEVRFNPAPSDSCSIVVMETGALFPSFVGEYQQSAPNSLVEVQMANESPAQFALRVIRKLDQVPLDLRAAIVATNGETHEECAAARYRIARAILRIMARSGNGEIVLTSDGEDEVRQSLFALAGTLCEDLRGSELGVRVRFSERQASSRTMLSVRPSSPEIVLNEGDRASGEFV
jgi:hypothetical protein